jgi:hypothetical protein
MEPADEPEMALEAAAEDGFLVVPNLPAAEEWVDAIARHEELRHSIGRAAIVAIIDLSGESTVVHYAQPPAPSYAGLRLRAVASRLAERFHGSGDFAFEHWTSGKLDGDSPESLASNLWRLDRFARNELGATEFEKGPMAARHWELSDRIMDMDPKSSSS